MTVENRRRYLTNLTLGGLLAVCLVALAAFPVERMYTAGDVIFVIVLIVAARLFQTEISGMVISQVDIVGVIAVCILPPPLAVLLMTIFVFSRQIFNNPRFRLVTEVMIHLIYGLCTAAVGLVVVLVERSGGFEAQSPGGFALVIASMVVFYVVNYVLLIPWVVFIKRLSFKAFMRENSFGFPIYNVILTPVAYIAILAHQQAPFGGWGGWVILALLLPLFYAQYVMTQRSRALENANNQIEESQKLLQSLTESVPIGIYRVTLQGQILSTNRTMAQMLGYDTPEELMQVNARELYAASQDRDQFVKRWTMESDVIVSELHLIRKDGSDMWARDNIHVTRDADGNILYIDGAIEDITIQRQIEHELAITDQLIRQAKQEWEATVDSLPSFVCLLDADMRVIRGNGILEVWGAVDRKRLNSMQICQVLADYQGDAPMRHLFEAGWHELQRGQSYRFEVARRDGEQIALIQLHPLRHSTHDDAVSRGSFAVMVMQDITVQRQIEQRLLEINAELEARVAERTAQLEKALLNERELNAFRARFASMISHEFRTPLAIIQTSVDLMERYARNNNANPQRRAEIPTRIRQQVKHLVALLEDIMTISQAETVGLHRNDKRVHLQSFCAMIEADMEQVIKVGQTFNFMAGDVSGVARMDEKLVHQLVMNLVSNAAKYSPDDGHITLEIGWEAGDLVIHVADDGIGIPQEAHPHLFEAFYRAGNVGAITGTGLGLAIVKLAIDLHNGVVTVESAPDAGTQFIVRLPVREKARNVEDMV